MVSLHKEKEASEQSTRLTKSGAMGSTWGWGASSSTQKESLLNKSLEIRQYFKSLIRTTIRSQY